MPKKTLKDQGYPDDPRYDNYLVFDVVPEPAFDDYLWDYKKLQEKPGGRLSACPFTVRMDRVLDLAISKRVESR